LPSDTTPAGPIKTCGGEWRTAGRCFDRNPGNGALAATATEADFVVAEQTLCHDAGHPSYITLPVIPRNSGT
jgi:predicted acyl esterase